MRRDYHRAGGRRRLRCVDMALVSRSTTLMFVLKVGQRELTERFVALLWELVVGACVKTLYFINIIFYSLFRTRYMHTAKHVKVRP